ncbi:MAG: tetratricopeptide repeat protein [Ignavibacteriales bacterium]|jgi:chemotaxis protein methyltransferase WspC|nr:tetratricopeptide repeat protein [Ignavibacteriales bacterium]MBP7542116.1 tetratricopeptide repeat protein [Ignavibacteriaceae bacterium]MCC6638549.1 tetratricopeptide repeat protein [Ignavibacteriaceae bacterium]
MRNFDAGLAALLPLLARTIGLDHSTIGIKSLELTLKRRLSQVNSDSALEYVNSLENDKSELQKFVEMIVVPETWFFRDQSPFMFLQEEVKSKFMRTVTQPLRILSIPSSTGEEPYSIVMALNEINYPLQLLAVDAVDISSVATDKAMRGVYGKSSFRGVEESIINKYFTVAGESFVLSEEIKKPVTFHNENLANPFFMQYKLPYDMIFCRNLIIYLDGKARETAINHIKRLLRPDGYLFSGHTEVMFYSSNGFRSVSHPKSFALYIDTPKPEPLRRPASRGSIERNVPLPPVVKRQFSTSKVEGKRKTIETPQAATPEFEYEYIQELANRGELTTARRKCEELLQKDPANKELICLMGEISLASGKVDEAENSFLRVLYLEPNHTLALVHISLLYEQKGDQTKSVLYKERLKRVSERSR